MSAEEMQFMEITNASLEDAQQFLTITENQVEQAIQLYFINSENPIEAQPILEEEPVLIEEEPQPRPVPVVQRRPVPVEHIPRPIDLVEVDEPFVEEPDEEDYDPADELDTRLHPFEQMERLLQQQTHSAFNPIAGGGFTQFVRQPPQPEEMFPPPSELVHHLPLERAQTIANNSSKWIFLIISDPAEFVSQKINRDLLKDEFIQELLNPNFYVVYYLQSSPNAAQFKQLYQFQKAPYICIIDPRTGERVRQYPHGHPLMKIEIMEWASELTAFLEEFDLEKAFIGNLSKQEKQVEQMTEEEQIELAMQQSMGTATTPRDSKDLMQQTQPQQPQGHFTLRLTPTKIELTKGIRVAVRLSSI